MKSVRLFPTFLEERERYSLMMEVSKEDLLVVMNTFQKGKSPEPDGWPIEFYLGFFDILGKDILSVVEESRINGHIHEPFNATFIALIPKLDNPTSFDDFRPISLCNCI